MQETPDAPQKRKRQEKAVPAQESPDFRHTSHFEMVLDTTDSVANQFLALGAFIRIIDDVKTEEVRVEGVRLIRAMADKLAKEDCKILHIAKR